jgi:hypothetical protein
VFVADGAELLDKQINEEIASGHYRVTALSVAVHPASGQLVALVSFEIPH